MEAFTACAVSDKKCVPQRVDDSAYPLPADCALDKSFDLNNFQARLAEATGRPAVDMAGGILSFHDRNSLMT